MTTIAWDDVPVNGDCYDAATWADMVTYIKHSSSCSFTIYDDELSTSQKFKFSYLGNDNTIEGDDTTAKNLILKATSADVYPIIELLGNTDIHFHKTAGRAMLFYDAATQAQKFTYAANVSTIEGGSVTGDDIILKGNSNDAYPKILLEGNSSIKQYFKAGSAFYLYDSAVQAFKQSHNANISTIEGGVTTGDDLILKANTTDNYSYIKLNGDGNISLYAGNYAIIYGDGGADLRAYFTGTGHNTIWYANNYTTGQLLIQANTVDAYPKILLEGNSSIKQYFKAGSAFYLYDSAVQAFKQSYAANVSTIEGGVTTGDDLILKANTTDAYPKIKLNGNVGIDYNAKGDHVFFGFDGLAQTMKQNYAAGTITWTGSTSSGRELKIKANDTDNYPFIYMLGNTEMRLQTTSGQAIKFYDGATEMASIIYAHPYAKIYGSTDATHHLVLYASSAEVTPQIDIDGNGDITINPKAGSYSILGNLVKFGVYSAKGAEAFDGFITILDQAGNTRKIMTCA